MRIFISAGEPSGDLHGANLIRELRARRPDLEIVGFGGDHMREAGATLLFPLVDLAVMFIVKVLAHIRTFWRLLGDADRSFRENRPDAVILIDYPGFHWWLARRAKKHGIPVYYFIAPQLWAWAPWRIHKVRRLINHVLCTLPFEAEWYQGRNVSAEYIGHPFFDELAEQKIDADFIASQKAKAGDIVALLPGSRNLEIERNAETLLKVAEIVHRERPGTRFLVAAFKEKHQEAIETLIAERGTRIQGVSIETHVGRTPEIIELCRACTSVSGSVALEMMYRKKPTAIVYRVKWMVAKLAKVFITVPYICLVNLLAGKVVFPEFMTHLDKSPEIAATILRWLNDPSAHASVVGELTALRDQVARPGACARAADAILARMSPAARKAA